MRKRFGYAEIIASLMGICCYYLVFWWQQALLEASIGDSYLYLYTPMLIVPIMAASFGIFAALATGVGGLIMTMMVFSRPVHYIEVFDIFIFSLILGFFCKRYKVIEGEFRLKQAVDYNVMQMAIGIVIWVLIHPLMSFLVYGEDFGTELVVGLRSLAAISLGLLTVGTIIMYMVSKIFEASYAYINKHGGYRPKVK